MKSVILSVAIVALISQSSFSQQTVRNLSYIQKPVETTKRSIAHSPRKIENDSLYVLKEFKYKKNSGKILIQAGNVSIEGYDGSEILFSSKILAEESDSKAEGLVMLSGNGIVDNTGLGLSVTEKNNQVEVIQVGKNNESLILIKVPNQLAISYNYKKSEWSNDDLCFKNIVNEVSVSRTYGNVKFENVTGPLMVNTVYGSIDAQFSKSVKGPVSIVSVYGSIDVGVQKETGAAIDFKTEWGSIYAAKDFKFDLVKTTEEKKGENINGKLNGGGFDLILQSNYGKIYLRTN